MANSSSLRHLLQDMSDYSVYRIYRMTTGFFLELLKSKTIWYSVLIVDRLVVITLIAQSSIIFATEKVRRLLLHIVSSKDNSFAANSFSVLFAFYSQKFWNSYRFRMMVLFWFYYIERWCFNWAKLFSYISIVKVWKEKRVNFFAVPLIKYTFGRKTLNELGNLRGTEISNGLYLYVERMFLSPSKRKKTVLGFSLSISHSKENLRVFLCIER